MHCNKTASSTDYLPRIASFAADRVANLSARFLGLALRLRLPLPTSIPAKLPGPDRARGRSHRLLKFEHELIHRLAARRLDREVARILGVAPEIAFGDELESGRLDFAA